MENDPTRTGAGTVPADREAEMAVLGSMIFDAGAIGEAMEVVKSEEFVWPAHRTIFDAIAALHLSNKPVDLVVLRDELARERKLDGAGGADYLMALVEGVPNSANVGTYAAIVRDKAALRGMLLACQRVASHIQNTNENVEEVRAEAERALFQALAKVERAKVRGFADILHDVFCQIQDVHDRKSRITGLSTGFYELDDMTSGLQKGHLYVVAGRPSMGKTSLAMNIVENVGLREGKPVLFFSLEMSAEQVAQTMLCSRARVDSSLLRSGRVAEEQFQMLVLAAGAFNESKILIDDSADLSALDMRTRARRWAASHGIELIVVDYLQKMSSARQAGRPHESRQVEIAAISSHLKSMAKELGVPVVALAQLNRGPEGREDRRPLLSDLRESGAIEQDADAVALLYREEYYDPGTEKKGVAELSLAKNRTGPTGTVELAFIKQYTRFENLAVARPQ
jgi:replicative DNA helicase